MKIEIVRFGTDTRIDLCDGHYSLGGQETDDLRVPGLPGGWMDLHVAGTALTVIGRAALLLEDSLVPAETPRLLLPHECIRVAEGVALRLAGYRAPVAPGTAAMLKDLLGQPLVPSPGRAAVLTCLTGLDAGVHFALSDEPSEIGRGEKAQIRIRDRAVSRRHARVTRRGDQFIIEDLGTPNGLYVNGQRIASPFALADDAVIEMGRSLLRFRTPQDEPPPMQDEDSVRPAGNARAFPHTGTPDDSLPGSTPEMAPVDPAAASAPEANDSVKSVSVKSVAREIHAPTDAALSAGASAEWALLVTGATLALTSAGILLVVA